MAAGKVIRVFARKTSYTPLDDYSFYGFPPLVIPEHREVHVSCTFTWDIEWARELAFQWEGRTEKPVKLGGPAFGSQALDFTPGLYLRPNIIFTTRGCDNNCPWCCVPKLEGKLRELRVVPGNIIQDNNFLQASRRHRERVFEMLHTQRRICFKGGLEAKRLDGHFVEAVRGLRIAELWLACDTHAALPGLAAACRRLIKAGFTRDKIKCYVLIGDDMDENEARLQAVYRAGAMPFAQLYRDYSEHKTEYSREWNRFARQWVRPAAIKAHVEQGTDFRNFGT